MLTFRQFNFLIESKLSDIKRGHINKGHDPNEVEDVINRAREANKQGAKIDISGNFQNVKANLHAHEQKQKSKQDIDVIHHNPETGVTIKKVNTRDACIKNYGHGKTNWCVAATGKDNVFDDYKEGDNKMFAIHHKNPQTGQEHVYGMHEIELGTIRKKNDDEVEHHQVHPDVWKAISKIPEMRNISLLARNPHHTFATEKEKQEAQNHVNKVLNKRITDYPNVNDNLDDAAQAVLHPLFGTHHSHITTALKSKEPLLKDLAVDHEKFGTHPDHFEEALKSDSQNVRDTAKQKLTELISNKRS